MEEFYHLLYKLLSNDQVFFGMEKIKEILLVISRSQNDLKGGNLTKRTQRRLQHRTRNVLDKIIRVNCTFFFLYLITGFFFSPQLILSAVSSKKRRSLRIQFLPVFCGGTGCYAASKNCFGVARLRSATVLSRQKECSLGRKKFS